MRGGGHELAVWNGVGVQARGDKTGHVGDIRHHHAARLVRDLPEGSEIDDPRIGGSSHDDQLGTVLESQRPDLVEIDRFRA